MVPDPGQARVLLEATERERAGAPQVARTREAPRGQRSPYVVRPRDTLHGPRTRRHHAELRRPQERAHQGRAAIESGSAAGARRQCDALGRGSQLRAVFGFGTRPQQSQALRLPGSNGAGGRH